MPILVTGGESRRWDHTPKGTIWTTRHRVRKCPDLSATRTAQRLAYDWALDVLEQSPALKVRAGTGKDSLWKKLTQARADGTLGRENLALQRAATAQAYETFHRHRQHVSGRAASALTEQDEATTPRTLRRLAKPPRATAALRRCHPSNQHKRQAIHILEGVRIADDDGHIVHVPGIGKVHLVDPVTEAPTSAQIVETRRGCWLHVQHGCALPEPKDPNGTIRGHDSGIRHTLTDDQGHHRQRPDTKGMEQQAQAIDRHRAKCCTKGSRQWRKLKKQAATLRRKCRDIHTNWERHTARDLSEETDVLAVENLSLRNMNASAKGTSSLPGAGITAKQGLNREMGRARIGHLHIALQRRCLKDGTWFVAVDPRNTSTTCSECGHADRESRKGEQFRCTRCGTQFHADENAGKNLKCRARNVLNGYLRARGGGDRRPGGLPVPYRQGSDDILGKTHHAFHPTDRHGLAGAEAPASGLMNNRKKTRQRANLSI